MPFAIGWSLLYCLALSKDWIRDCWWFLFPAAGYLLFSPFPYLLPQTHCNCQYNSSVIPTILPWIIKFAVLKDLVLAPPRITNVEQSLPIAVLLSVSSIHPSSTTYLWSGRGGSRLSIPDILLPSSTFQLLLGDPKVFPGQVGYLVPPASSRSVPGSHPNCSCLVHLSREARRRHPNRMPRPLQR